MSQSHFHQNSFWTQDPVLNIAGPEPCVREFPFKQSSDPTPHEIDVRKLEDWSLRLERAATEAADAKLLALESDLLDLRDETVFELHKRI